MVRLSFFIKGEVKTMNETWLAHHGIKGQKWGVRRFENKDGSLTEAGKKRYSKANDEQEDNEQTNKKKIAKKIAIGAAFVAGTGLAIYGGFKLKDYYKGKKTPASNKVLDDLFDIEKYNNYARERDKKILKETEEMRKDLERRISEERKAEKSKLFDDAFDKMKELQDRHDKKAEKAREIHDKNTREASAWRKSILDDQLLGLAKEAREETERELKRGNEELKRRLEERRVTERNSKLSPDLRDALNSLRYNNSIQEQLKKNKKH